jgi:hypothetical protein
MLSWVHAHYTDLYDDAWNQAYGSAFEETSKKNPMTPALDVEQLAKQVGCTAAEITGTIQDVENDILAWPSVESEVLERESKLPYKYEQVHFDGLPYLLRIERNDQEERLRVLLKRMEKLRDIMHQMEKLINYQSLLDRARDSPVYVDHSATRDANRQHPVNRTPLSAVQIAAQRLSLLQSGDIANIMMNSTFLTVKMAIMVYVFTRGASSLKTGMIAGLAFLYVTFETYKMTQRRLHMRMRAMQQAMGVQAGPQNEARAVPMTRQSSRTQNEVQENGNDEIVAPQSPVQYRVASPILLEYWIERIALWNLAQEDEQLGFQPAVGRTRQARRRRRGAQADQSVLIRALRDYVMLPLLLFIVTLVPAIEQKRRRAIDLRDDLIRSTARKHEEQQERLRRVNEADKQSIGQPAPPEVPPFLQSAYAQDILRRRGQGRQIDIGQELDAAAAANEDEGGLDQVDMGFL